MADFNFSSFDVCCRCILGIDAQAIDVNSSLQCLLVKRCHCVRPLDLLDVPSARRRAWDDMMSLEI